MKALVVVGVKEASSTIMLFSYRLCENFAMWPSSALTASPPSVHSCCSRSAVPLASRP